MAQNITKLSIYMYIKRVLTYINSSQKTFLGGVLALAKLVQMVDLWYGRAPYGRRRRWSRRCRRHRCRGCRRWSRAVDSHPRQLDRTGGSSALSLRLVEVRQRLAVMATLGGTGPAGGGRAAVTVDDDEVVLSVCYQLEGGRRPVYAIKCPFLKFRPIIHVLRCKLYFQLN